MKTLNQIIDVIARTDMPHEVPGVSDNVDAFVAYFASNIIDDNYECVRDNFTESLNASTSTDFAITDYIDDMIALILTTIDAEIEKENKTMKNTKTNIVKNVLFGYYNNYAFKVTHKNIIVFNNNTMYDKNRIKRFKINEELQILLEHAFLYNKKEVEMALFTKHYQVPINLIRDILGITDSNRNY